jgi:ferredoxin
MKRIIFLFLTLLSQQTLSQNDSLKKLNFNAYGELYYSYDFSNPQHHEKSNFLYNHKRHNEVNANLLLLKGSYLDKNYRANLALMAGNYAQYNLSTEPNWAQFIYEANIGVKLSKKKNIWLDAGILPSHIGFESAISADCWTLTRSLLAENSPYYETGIKLSYSSKNEKLYLSALFLNGWQKIQRSDYIQRPSFGTQLIYKKSNKISINYSTFIGSDKSDSMNDVKGIVAECGGSCMCATCHVYIDEQFLDLLPEMEEEEAEMLEGASAEIRPNSRLGCQVRLSPKLDGIIVRIPEKQ